MGELAATPDGRRISYAQNGEDIVLLRAFAGQTEGFWIDVGANHPVRDSVTKNFHDLGWTGINVEPVVAFFRELEAQRPSEINICAAVSDTDGVMVFHRNDSNLDLSTFDEHLAGIYRDRGDSLTDIEVDVRRLAAICADHIGQRPIDFLKVDTEGHELAVLRGHDFVAYPVRVVCAEATDHRLPDLISFLEPLGMVHVTFDGLNAWFVRQDELSALRPLIARPPSPVLDWYHPAVYVGAIESLAERTAELDRCRAERDALAADAAGRRAPWTTRLRTAARRRRPG